MSDRPHFWLYKTHSDTAELSSRVDFRTFSHSQGVALLQKSSLCHSLSAHLPRHCSVPWEGKHRAHKEPQGWAKAGSLGCCKDITPVGDPTRMECICQSLHCTSPVLQLWSQRDAKTLGEFWLKLFEMFHRRCLLDKLFQYCKVRGSS